VKAGDLLLRLDLGETALAVPRDRAGLESAEARLKDLAAGSRSAEIGAARADVQDKRAALDLAARERDRQNSLLAQQITTHQEFDRAKTDFERAQAALEASEQRLELTLEGFRKWQKEQARADVEHARGVLRQSETVASEAEIHAPADAIVLHRMAEPGLLVAPGQPALTLAFADRLYVRTFIPETDLGRVRPGQRATVAVDAYPGREFPARVTEISPNAEFTPKQVETKRERVDLVYAAKVDLDGGWNVPLIPGQPAEVTIVAADSDGAHARTTSAMIVATTPTARAVTSPPALPTAPAVTSAPALPTALGAMIAQSAPKGSGR
jgi:HlyD family secretion protein